MAVLFPPPTPLNAALWRGRRVGLLGGSFNPAHEGHVHISLIALRTFRLDCVWWLVSPQNPLKSVPQTAPYDTRLRQCLDVAASCPRIVVSDMERQLGTVRTYDTLTGLLPRFSDTQFIWLAGYDNAAGFGHWYRWRDIPTLTAMAHIARPPVLAVVQHGPLRHLRHLRHIVTPMPGNWPLTPFSAYWLPGARLNGQSSTRLRRDGI